jgi:cbb3-type cytochrome oxidase maturation protein
MDVLFVMIPLGLVLVVFAIWSFVWSVKHDQFDDLERQGWSILFDDDKPVKTPVSAAKAAVANPAVAKPLVAKDGANSGDTP